MKTRPSGAAAVLAAVFIINFLSLVLQIVWTRRIMVIFGSSALSISTTLTVFLGGIAIGGYVGGRWVRTLRDTRRFAGYALILLGVYCLFSIELFGLIRYPFLGITGSVESPFLITIIKFVFSALALILPTTIIGAMFPVMTELYSDEFRRFGKDVASVYALDTVGAAAGAVLAGFFLIPWAGLRATAVGASVAYILTGAALAFIGRAREGAAARTPSAAAGRAREEGPAGDPPAKHGALRAYLLAALFVSGLSALMLEVAWSRFFHHIFGTSIYAFALVVAAFLAGLSAGSFAVKRWLDRAANPVLLFGYIEMAIALVSLAVIESGEALEALYLTLYHATSNFHLFNFLLLGAAFLVMLVPASLMGANFPLAVKILARERNTRGFDAGEAFSVNTAGGIVGAFIAGFLVIPAIGAENASRLASASYLAIGAPFVWFAASGRAHRGAAALMTAAFIAIAAAASMAAAPLGMSVYYNGLFFKTPKKYFEAKRSAKIIHSKQGLYGAVAVELAADGRTRKLWINGKVDASTLPEDMITQELLGHLPAFFHRAPERVLIIGLGSGISVGAAASHPDVKTVDCVELDPLVGEAARMHFGDYNGRALEDPKVRMHYEDGRHWLDTSGEKFDVIVSEPSNIWISGVSQLFSREFYSIAAGHLKPGGILAQWMPGYELTDEELALILATLRGRFAHAGYWTNGYDVIILASDEALVPDYARAGRLFADRRVAADLGKAFTAAPPNMPAILDGVAYSSVLVPAITKDVALANTDDLNRLEFNTIRNYYDFSHGMAGGRTRRLLGWR